MATISPIATLTLPAAIDFRVLPSQLEPLAGLRGWLNTGQSGIGLLTGPGESGRTRLIEQMLDEDAIPSSRLIGLVGGTGGKRSDAGLLRDAIVALGQTPTGRNGLELTGELRQITMAGSPLDRPLLLAIDDANLTGSQLEIVAALFTSPDAPSTTLPLQVLLVGPPELNDRVMRRPRLAALVTTSVQTVGLQATDIMRLLDAWLRTVRDKTGVRATISNDARQLLANVAGFSPSVAFGLIEEAMTASLAMGREHINRGVVETIVAHVSPLPPAKATETTLAAVREKGGQQIMMQLPGFELEPIGEREEGRR